MTDSHVVVERVGKILIVSIVLLSVLLILISLLHLYAKWFRYRREELNPTTTNTRSSRRRQEQQSAGVTVLRRGLSPSFLETLAVTPFDPKLGERLECAICLSDVGGGEKTRMLPKCDHGFHVECIDMWFYSHSTCPICRNPVEELLETTQEEEEGESGDFPTNILFWGDETEVSTLTSQLEEAPVLNNSQRPSRPDVVIDISIPIILSGRTDDWDEDHKSPVSSRMRSITRILSDL